jgi:hypothetical protein
MDEQPTWHPMHDGLVGTTLGLQEEAVYLLIEYESLEQAQAAQQWLAGDMQ